MKTAISLPDAVYERATRRAGELGMSRSELFARAVGHFLDELDADSTTRRINAALDAVDAAKDDSGALAVAAGRDVLAHGDDW